MALAPSGELTSVGIGKETTFGVAATPTLWLICSDQNFAGTNELLDRPGARKRIGRTRSVPGTYMGKGSMTCEADPDTIGALLYATCGAEAIAPNVNNPGSTGTINTTLSAALPGRGGQIAHVASSTGIVVGDLLDVDTSGNLETVQVVAVSSGTFTAFFTKAHLSGVAVVSHTLQLAYDHTFTLASPRPSFTAEENQIIEARSILGNKISTLALAMNEKSILEAKVGTEFQAETDQPSPTTPSFSTIYPFTFEYSGQSGTVNGVQSDATIQSWSVDINTGLITDFPSFGKGRFRQQMPETITKVSGQLMLAFETMTMYKLFWGNPSASGPASILLPVSLGFNLFTPNQINDVVTYGLQVVLGECKLASVDRPSKTKDYIKQTVKYEAYETANQAGDDVKFILTNASNAASF